MVGVGDVGAAFCAALATTVEASIGVRKRWRTTSAWKILLGAVGAADA